MRKWILILGFSLILTGCTRPTTLKNNSNAVRLEMIDGIGYSKEKSMYINEDMKNVIQDINNLREKYKDYIDERGYDSLYIDTYEEEYRNVKDVDFNNRSISNDEYFYDLVEILDRTIAEGLKDYVLDMENKDLKNNGDTPEESIIKKIGRTVVYVENKGEKNNYMNIRINFLDVEADYYREVFNKISDEKYILNNLVMGEKLNLMDFVNSSQLYNHYYHAKDVKIRYNIFFKDKDIEKVNILMQGENGAKFKDDDITVFVNLLNSLDLKGEEKDLLVNEYKNIFERKINSKKISLDNYNIYINDNKGNSNSRNNWDLVYFSIERN